MQFQTGAIDLIHRELIQRISITPSSANFHKFHSDVSNRKFDVKGRNYFTVSLLVYIHLESPAPEYGSSSVGVGPLRLLSSCATLFQHYGSLDSRAVKFFLGNSGYSQPCKISHVIKKCNGKYLIPKYKYFNISNIKQLLAQKR